MAELDPRLGRIEGDSIIYPQQTLGGNPYRVALTTRGIGDGYFVVLDPSPTYNVETEIVALLTILQINKRPSVKVQEAPKHETIRPSQSGE